MPLRCNLRIKEKKNAGNVKNCTFAKSGQCQTTKSMKTIIAEEYRRYTDFILSIPSLFDTDTGETLKDKRNSVKRIVHDGVAFIAKRYKRANLIQRIVYTYFRRTKAERAYAFATEFQRRGVSSPKAVAYMEEKEHGLFTVGYFIYEESKGKEAFLELVDKPDFNKPLADAITDYIVFMHSRGVLHGDLNSANFLYTTDSDGKYRFDMIDTNRSHFVKGWPTRKQCMENLKRFTHRRDLYEYVIRGYARRRGWNEEETLNEALHILNRFEHKRKPFVL